jgi:hypothetical protein
VTEKSARLKLGWDFENLTWYQSQVEEKQNFSRQKIGQQSLHRADF